MTIVKISDIQQAVAEEYGLTVEELLSQSRKRHITKPRQVAMWLCRRLTAHSYPDILSRFSLTNHTTVLHAKKTVDKRIASDCYFAEKISQLERRLIEEAREINKAIRLNIAQTGLSYLPGEDEGQHN